MRGTGTIYRNITEPSTLYGVLRRLGYLEKNVPAVHCLESIDGVNLEAMREHSFWFGRLR